ncbi:IVNS1ABP [Cordylochernes scorpioides]|uniref:IVNS1ABP n=1 Tax=Cordylochernes scorpioides TaxID=51811 RepID=A0ABY6KEM0_9ARAC|nr:IVNS1ABP [Cordylochernes scorpioides]
MATTNGMVNGFTHESGCFLYQDTELLPQVFSNLNKLRKNRQFCDVIFQIGKGAEVHEVAAHKAVLASASPYLLDLLTREQGGSQGPSLPVKLGPNFELEAFEALVDYCYTGRLQAPSSQVHHLFTTAHRLKLGHASRKCGDYLVSNLQPSNCIFSEAAGHFLHHPTGLSGPCGSLHCHPGHVFSPLAPWGLPSSRASCWCAVAMTGEKCLKTVEVYDTDNNTWTMLKPMRVPRGRFDITVVDDKVYAIGGSDGTTELSSAEFYDPRTDEWAKLPPSPIVRSNAGRNQCGVAAMNGALYAVGGCEAWNCLNSVEKYSLSTGTWSYLAPMATPRRGCGVVPYHGKLYVIGGHDGVYSLCTTEIYDPETDTWSPGPSLTSCRANVGVAVVRDRLYAVGGFNGKAFLNTIEFLDPHLNEWTTFVPGDQPRNGCFTSQPPPLENGTSNNNHHNEVA